MSLLTRLKHRYSLALAPLVSLVVAAVSLIGVGVLAQAEKQAQLRVLHSQAYQIQGLIESRFRRQENRVQAAAALFASSDHVDRDEWRRFVEMTDHQDDGMFEMFWVERISAAELSTLQGRLADEGIADFQIQPPGSRDLYCPMVYIEPFEIRRSSLGLDVCSRSKTEPAARRAMLTGRIQVSAPVDLTSGVSDPLRGYVLLAWVDASAEQEAGWVGGTVAIETLFSGLDDYPHLALTFHDPSDFEQPPLSINPPAGHARNWLQTERPLALGGRSFHLEFRTAPGSRLSAILLVAAGLAIALLLGALVASGQRTQARAEKMAQQATQAFRNSEQLLESVTSNISEGIYRGVPGHGLVYINQALAKMFGFDDTNAMMAQSGPILYASPSQRENLHQLLIEDGAYRNQEVEFVRPDGSHFFASNSAVATRNDDGSIAHFDGVISDITERKQVEEAVHRLAHYDSLTGLPNRTLLNDRIGQAIAHASRRNRPIAVMFMDLDRFKAVNDSLGHAIGDQLLVAVSERLQIGLRQYDTISRLGGDEFVIVMPGAGFDVATRKASSLIQDFAKVFEIDGHELVITPSIGIAIYPEDGTDPEGLLRNADTAMYHAKERGRATFEFFTSELNQRAYERLSTETHLRGALANNELHLHYQPIVEPGTGRIQSVEALLRWNSPVLGRVSPEQFIPVAEQSGLIVEIGRWVIETAMQQLASWKRLGMKDLRVCVNVSAVQFWRGNLVQCIQQALADSALAGRDLEIELTENVIMSDVDIATTVLDQLRPLGVRLAIDDFGIGYSSLSYLKQFRIDRLKIDKSFIQELKTDSDDAAIVSAVLSMARDLGIEVVAEGVETAEQLAYLIKRQCNFVQGYYFSRPLPPNDLMRLWARTNG
ncbi:MAG: EAL domain-containing protein [Wenzhouxiangella sp.]|jgi:diguanylate cyclase (GGDEF)-like protein/PAS domain S-box-containing protein|nr:EAL domain-containing protein [Wenzhouxiangella sp.]